MKLHSLLYKTDIYFKKQAVMVFSLCKLFRLLLMAVPIFLVAAMSPQTHYDPCYHVKCQHTEVTCNKTLIFSPSPAATLITSVSMLEAQFLCITLKPFFTVLLNIFKTSYSRCQELQNCSFLHQENHENYVLLFGKSFPHNQTSFVGIA